MNVAFVFPGQGSQSIGMLATLASRFPIIQNTFDHVSERLGYDVWQLTQQGPESLLNQTEHTQVAVLTADVAIFRLIQSQARFDSLNCWMAGHSLGEYAALVCAEAIPLADAAELVATRGKLMQTCTPLGEGAMAAIIGLTDAEIDVLCQRVSASFQQQYQVTPANYNAIGQVVIAGHTEAVEKAIGEAESLGARMAKIIPVSVPCHCPLLTEAAEAFEAPLAKAPFQAPRYPVIANVDLSTYKTPEQMRLLLKKQLYSPVRWVETIQSLKNQGVECLIESGPGNVLSGLVKRIDKTLSALPTHQEDFLERALRRITNEQLT
ncbi:MAG: ACP S-malonyltransferase [Legionella sp.]|nr:ACP S-malonyltransferase [Legionella sp.]